jgi:FMN phosphatase YigB (HAD superfamily)
MQVFSLPVRVRGIIFDIDGTLYRHEGYMKSQTRVQIERLAARLGRPFEDVDREVRACAERLALENGGRKTSLANTLKTCFAIPVETSIAWREELLAPERYLGLDERLVETFRTLSERNIATAAVTNNPGSIGRRTLAALGVERFFRIVIGLERTGISKPALEPFRLASRELGMAFSELVNVGDRRHVDLELPLAAGLGGILVESMEDLYALPDTLADRIDPGTV